MADANLISKAAQVRLTELHIQGQFWLISLLRDQNLKLKQVNLSTISWLLQRKLHVPNEYKTGQSRDKNPDFQGWVSVLSTFKVSIEVTQYQVVLKLLQWNHTCNRYFLYPYLGKTCATCMVLFAANDRNLI